jgi:uncharacterized protein (TIRG00374 family)
MRPALVWLSLAAGLLLFIPFAVTADWSHAAQLLREANPEYLLLYLAATTVIICLLALRWHVVTRASGIDVPYRKQLTYHIARFAVSFVTPGPRVGGDAVAAGLLTRHTIKRRKARFSEAFSTLALDRAVEVQTFAVLFFMGVLYFTLTGSLPVALRIPVAVFSAAVLGIAVLIAVGLARKKLLVTALAKRFAKKRKTIRAIESFEQITQRFYRTKPKSFLTAVGVSALAWLLSLVEYTAVLRLLGFDPALWMTFLIFSFVGFAYIIPIPLALGTLESAQSAAFALVGLAPVGGILLAFLIRIRDGTIALLGFIILATNGLNRKRLS